MHGWLPAIAITLLTWYRKQGHHNVSSDAHSRAKAWVQVISITLTISLLTWLFVTSAVVALAPWVPVLHSVPRPHMHMLASLAGTLMIARSPATAVRLSFACNTSDDSAGTPRGGKECTDYTLMLQQNLRFRMHMLASLAGTHHCQIFTHSCEQPSRQQTLPGIMISCSGSVTWLRSMGHEVTSVGGGSNLLGAGGVFNLDSRNSQKERHRAVRLVTGNIHA